MVRRLHQTLADYVVIAISPALIMGLVGSLMFFLLRVFYQGAYQERLHWVMACFVFGSVLIGRISIEEGFERAAPFGAALGLLVGIAANRFMEYRGTWIDDYSWIINFALIGLVWWCAHQLTWDCTVIDDSQDASGEGLMQVVGLERAADQRNETASKTSDDKLSESALEGTTSRAVPASFWQRYVEHQRRPHAPGVWVVYFSLAALPIFGVGQWLIPATDTAGRRYVFWLMCLYVASGLGLLLTTSFLGLRRYLRQRRIEMPTLMANVWLSAGAAIIVALLVAAALLPRPSAEFAISQLPISVGSPTQDASKIAPADDEGTEDKQPGSAAAKEKTDRATDSPPPEGAGNQPGGNSKAEGGEAKESDSKSPGGEGKESSPGSGEQDKSGGESSNGKSQGKPADPSSKPAGVPSNADSQAESQSPENKPSEAQSKQAQSKQAQPKQAQPKQSQNKRQDAPAKEDSKFAKAVKQYRQQQKELAEPYTDKPKVDESPPSEPAAGNEPAETPPMTPPDLLQPALSPLMSAVKWGFYVLLALAVLYALWRYRHDVLAAIRAFLAELANWWAALWGGRRDFEVAEDDVLAIRNILPPFASFADPFVSGTAAQLSVEELVRYSFDAFEAWAREHGCPRSPEQTPHELVRDVQRLNAPIAADARNLAELYVRAAYARGKLPDDARRQLEQLWRQMSRREMLVP